MPRGTNPTFTAGANAANALIPIEASREIIKVATEQSVVLSLASKQDMGTQLRDMPVLATKPSAYFVTGDTGLKQTTTAAWKNIRLTAEEIAVLIVIPNNVMNDASRSLWDQLRPEVGEAIGKALDAAVLFGTNKPASWPAALGIQAQTATNNVRQGSGGAGTDIADDINNVLKAVSSDGFTPSGIVMRQDLRYTLQGLRDANRGLIFQPNDPGVSTSTFAQSPAARTGSIWGVPTMTTLSGVFEDHDAATAFAIELLAVDWSQVIIGVRQDISVDFSNSAIITDAGGVVQMNAFQQDSTVGRFVARFAYAVPNPITRLNATEATRWPAAVLEMVT